MIAKAKTLPKWAKREGTIRGRPVIGVDANAAYEAWLAELSVKKSEIDQYWLECAYQCIKLELQSLLGFVIEIHIHDTEKKYAQKKWPAGRGPVAASRGLEAREHFKRLRGSLPEG